MPTRVGAIPIPGEPARRVGIPPDPTLGSLIVAYLQEVTPRKSESAQQHDRRAAGLFLECFGPERRASTPNRRDWDHFIEWRKRKGDTRGGKAHGRPVNGRAIAHNLKFLHAVLNWAVTIRDPAGCFLLDRNPLKRLPWPRVTAVRRPALDAAQYAALRAVAPLVHPLTDLALVLAYETGHRIGAIRQLRWSDVDDTGQRVRWRGATDKTPTEHTTPLSDAAALALSHARRCHVGDGWVFPSPSDPARPVSKNLARDWWREMERHAGLAPEPPAVAGTVAGGRSRPN